MQNPEEDGRLDRAKRWVARRLDRAKQWPVTKRASANLGQAKRRVTKKLAAFGGEDEQNKHWADYLKLIAVLLAGAGGATALNCWWEGAIEVALSGIIAAVGARILKRRQQ